jgi:hypothetical protein
MFNSGDDLYRKIKKIETMPIANNLLTSAILAPLVTILSAISLASLQRAIEWVSAIAKTPQA